MTTTTIVRKKKVTETEKIRAEIEQFAIKEIITIEKTGEERNVVAHVECSCCHEQCYALKGKAMVYTYCLSCSNDFYKSNNRQWQLIAMIKKSLGLPDPQPEPVVEEPVVTAPAPVAEPAFVLPMGIDPAKLKGKSLMQIFLEWKPFGD